MFCCCFPFSDASHINCFFFPSLHFCFPLALPLSSVMPPYSVSLYITAMFSPSHISLHPSVCLCLCLLHFSPFQMYFENVTSVRPTMEYCPTSAANSFLILRKMQPETYFAQWDKHLCLPFSWNPVWGRRGRRRWRKCPRNYPINWTTNVQSQLLSDLL